MYIYMDYISGGNCCHLYNLITAKAIWLLNALLSFFFLETNELFSVKF